MDKIFNTHGVIRNTHNILVWKIKGDLDDTKVREIKILKEILIKRVWPWVLHSDSGQRPVASCFVHSSERSDSSNEIKVAPSQKGLYSMSSFWKKSIKFNFCCVYIRGYTDRHEMKWNSSSNFYNRFYFNGNFYRIILIVSEIKYADGRTNFQFVFTKYVLYRE
jgi:hypothetical protein